MRCAWRATPAGLDYRRCRTNSGSESGGAAVRGRALYLFILVCKNIFFLSKQSSWQRLRSSRTATRQVLVVAAEEFIELPKQRNASAHLTRGVQHHHGVRVDFTVLLERTVLAVNMSSASPVTMLMTFGVLCSGQPCR